MPHRRSRSSLILLPVVLLIIAGFIGILVALGVRPDTQDVTPRAPSAQERHRQELAESITRLAAHPEGSARTQELSSQWLEGIGGVWIAWPDGAPSGHTNSPVHTQAPASDANIADMLAEISQQALDVPAGADTASSAALASLSLGARLAAVDMGGTCGNADPVAAGRALADRPAALEASEAARQWLETDAAALTPGERDPEIERIDSITAFQSAILEQGKLKDTRPAVIPAPKLSGSTTLTDKALDTLAGAMLADLDSLDADEREAVVSYACGLYLTAEERASAGAFPGAN